MTPLQACPVRIQKPINLSFDAVVLGGRHSSVECVCEIEAVGAAYDARSCAIYFSIARG